MLHQLALKVIQSCDGTILASNLALLDARSHPAILLQESNGLLSCFFNIFALILIQVDAIRNEDESCSTHFTYCLGKTEGGIHIDEVVCEWYNDDVRCFIHWHHARVCDIARTINDNTRRQLLQCLHLLSHAINI